MPRSTTHRLDKIPYGLLYAYALGLMLVAFLMDSPREVLSGFIGIQFEPDQLITDYFETSGVGAAFFNSGISTLFTIFLIHRTKSPVAGPLFATILTVSGFAFFGKNIFNSIPITMGAFLYARHQKSPVRSVLLAAIFGTSLGPIVSQVAFGWDFPLYVSIPSSFLVGNLVGYLLPPLANQFIRFHQGFNLYNIGFTAGIIGMVFVSVFRMFNLKVEPAYHVYEGSDTIMYVVFGALSLFFIAWGVFRKGGLKDLQGIFRAPGTLVSDFVTEFGVGATMINVGLSGILCLLYLYFLEGNLNGPAIGGVLTVMGFSAFGKHVRNILPVFIGVSLAMSINAFDFSATESILTLLFATTLAPIAGYYGFFYGIVAGFLHTSVVANIGYVHGGLNLYNNGFAGGFVAAFLVPFLDMLTKSSRRSI